jgi:hypothetical protein
MNENAPLVDGHSAAVSQNKFCTMTKVADDHDRALATPNVTVRFILASGPKTSSLKLKNVIVHFIRDGGMNRMNGAESYWQFLGPA